MFELYHTPFDKIGSLAEVWIDKEAGLCKKYYRSNGITANGKTTRFSEIDKITKFFNNEIIWSSKLADSGKALRIYEYGKLPEDSGYYLIQEYIGPDLFTVFMAGKLHSLYPNIQSQVEDMFKLLQAHNMHKLNFTLSNLAGHNGIIKMFDFKYARHRTAASKELELYAITEWLTKIDSNITDKLTPYI